ncbi:unnamed protein product [Boreogadus saida]
MAALQEPEIQFAQRLASNEKPIRSKAITKLRKYIIVRSHKSKVSRRMCPATTAGLRFRVATTRLAPMWPAFRQLIATKRHYASSYLYLVDAFSQRV